MGWAALLGIGLVGMRVMLRLVPSRAGFAFGAGLFLILEWHLVWAAGSGMETLLFSLVVLLVLGELLGENPGWLFIGFLVGVSVWLRPDGITLAGPCLLMILVSRKGWKDRLVSFFVFFGAVSSLLLPYLLMNQGLSGAWWPNTFFAKQAEYAIHRQAPLWQRYLQQLRLLAIGPGVMLIPGFIFCLILAVRRRAWGVLAGVVWLLGYLLLYALRLPVIYQYGRYIMPAMPVYFIWSLSGMAEWIRPLEPLRWRWVLGRAWLASLTLIWLAFWWIGGRAYAISVAIIESEMVDTARWVAANTEPQTLIAAHDIGALGYFGERPLVDLAGLVSPEVIPFLRDESRLANFLNERGADYLMTFPGWYPELIQHGREVHSSQGQFSPLQGGENMRIYRWDR